MMARSNQSPATATGWDAPGRVRPWWLEQRVRKGEVALSRNATARNWTRIATVGGGAAALVDPAGLLTPVVDGEAGWSLDWWVGAPDHWHVPSRTPSVRQSLVGLSPVVETLMRVPGGDVACVASAVAAGSALSMPMMEVHNRGTIPVAVALVVRPYNAAALAAVRDIQLDVDGRVLIDGCVGLLLPKPPAATVWSTFAAGDVLRLLEAEPVGVEGPRSVHCSDAGAQAAFVFPLSHSSRIQVGLPPRSARGQRTPPPPSALPPAELVARGWELQAARGTRITLPPGRLADAAEANRRYLLAAPRQPSDVRHAAVVAAALEDCGLVEEAAALLIACLTLQTPDGCFGPGGGHDSTSAVVGAIARHWRLTRDTEMLQAALAAVALGARALRPARKGLLAPGVIAGLIDTAELLEAGGQLDLARRAASYVRDRFEAEWAEPIVDAGPVRSARAVLDAAHREVAAGNERALDRLRWMLDMASPTFAWPEMIDVGSGHGRDGTDGGQDDDGHDHDGHDGWTTAAFVSLVRRLLVRDAVAGQVVLCSMLPAEWVGQAIEVHDAYTATGIVSFGVRWHGPRPALLWDLSPHDEGAAVSLTSPGLDPTWSTTELVGEALLGARR